MSDVNERLIDAIEALGANASATNEELIDAIKALRADMRDNAERGRVEDRVLQALVRESLGVIKDIRSLIENDKTLRDLPRRVEALESRLAAGVR